MDMDELIRAAKGKTGIPLYLLDDALKAFLEVIVETTAAGEPVRLMGFGTFSLVDRAERLGRNFQTQTPMTIPARRVPSFSPGTRFMAAVSGNEGEDAKC